MANVFANGLEISGKAVGAKTIACFPDVCFTPPQTPATPPGVPIPYPSFGMASDTENGSSTVFIGGKTVNIKNKSDLSRTTGTEAGCAPKKGVVSSKNTGKSFFNSWSPNVKFDGEPVIRNTDLATHNHGSPTNTAPWVHIAGVAVPAGTCAQIFAELDGHQHEDKQEKCNYTKTGRESEHTTRAAALMHTRGSKSCTNFPNYDEQKAPCICMNAKRVVNKKKQASKAQMPHSRKTEVERNFLAKGRAGCEAAGGGCKGKCTLPTVGELTEKAADATAQEHERTKRSSKEKKKEVSDCLQLINLAYIAGVKPGDDPATAQKKIDDTAKKKVCGKGVCNSKSSKCVGCGC